MKIVYYTSPFFLDCDFPLLKAFKNKGHDVRLYIVLTSSSLKSTLLDMKRIDKPSGVYPISSFREFCCFKEYFDENNSFVVVREDMHFYSWKSFKLQMKIFKSIKSFNPDIIQLTLYPTEFEPFLYIFRKKIVQLVHDPFPHSGEVRNALLINIKLSTMFFKAFIMLNNRQRKAFVEKYHLQKKKVGLAKLGIYECMNKFASNKKVVNIDNYVLFFGRISPYKGVEYLIKAVNKLNGKTKLVIAGGGQLYFSKDLYEDNRNIIVINRYMDMYELYSLIKNASIIVCPYIDATQSGVIMTAYSLCKPVVVTNVGGLPDMVDDGKTGFVVEAKSSSAIYHALLKFLESPSLFDEVKENIKDKYYNGRESWDSIAHLYINIYNDFLNHD